MEASEAMADYYRADGLMLMHEAVEDYKPDPFATETSQVRVRELMDITSKIPVNQNDSRVWYVLCNLYKNLVSELINLAIHTVSSTADATYVPLPTFSMTAVSDTTTTS
jgi:hypothetical protein